MSDSICNSNKVTTGNSSSSQRDDHKASFATPIKPDNPNKMNILSPSNKSGKRVSVLKTNDLGLKIKNRGSIEENFTERINFDGRTIEEKKKRFDRKGVEINSKNKKKVKVTFVDSTLNQPLVEVINIESYKDYNVVGYSPPENEVFGKTNTCCSCVLF